jgi:hypothetical protein
MHNQSSQLDKTRQPTANLTCNRAGGSYAQPLHWDSFHSNRVCLPWDFAPSRPDERLLHGHKLGVSFGLHAPTLEQHLTTLFSKNYTPLEITRSISHKLLVPERPIRHGGATFTRRFRPAGIASECIPFSGQNRPAGHSGSARMPNSIFTCKKKAIYPKLTFVSGNVVLSPAVYKSNANPLLRTDLQETDR